MKRVWFLFLVVGFGLNGPAETQAPAEEPTPEEQRARLEEIRARLTELDGEKTRLTEEIRAIGQQLQVKFKEIERIEDDEAAALQERIRALRDELGRLQMEMTQKLNEHPSIKPLKDRHADILKANRELNETAEALYREKKELEAKLGIEGGDDELPDFVRRMMRIPPRDGEQPTDPNRLPQHVR